MPAIKCPECHWGIPKSDKDNEYWCAVKGSDCWVADSNEAPEWYPTQRAKLRIWSRAPIDT